jgi:hypothetical protein
MGHRKVIITIFTIKEYIVLIQTHDKNILSLKFLVIYISSYSLCKKIILCLLHRV